MLTAVDDQEKISLIDDTIQSTPASAVSLHILARETGWEAGVFHRTDHRWLGIHSAPEGDLSFRGPDWMNREFGKVHLTWLGNRFSIIPDVLFDDKKTELYLNTGVGTDAMSKTFVRPLRHLGAQFVFGIPLAIVSKAQSLWPGVEFHHQGVFTIDPLLGKNKNSQGKKVQVHIYDQQLEILVTEGNRLLLYNVFPSQIADEAAYHIMNTYEVLQMNPDSVPVMIGGKCGKNSSLYALLYKYVRHVEHFPFPEGQQLSYRLAELPPYRFHALFSQCES